MKILHVIHDFLPGAVGGTEIYTYSLCKELSKRNEVYLFFGDSEIDKQEFIKTGCYDDLAFMSINPIQYTGHFAYLNLLKFGGFFTCLNKKVDKAFNTLINEFRPDIIHFQHLLGLPTNLVNIADLANIPMVFTAHDYWLLCPNAHLIDNNLRACTAINNKSRCVKCLRSSRLYGFEKIKISQPKTYIELPKNLIKPILNYLSILYNYIYIYYFRPKAILKIIKKIDLFITPSHRLYDKLVEGGVPGDKIVYIGLGIANVIKSDFQKTSSKQLRFAFIGPLVPSKGIHILIEAFNNIEKASLDIYGPLWEDTKRRYMKLIANKNIKLRGEFKNEEVQKIFYNIDILIVPSICIENSPLTIREAFAAKTPVIASNIGGLPEMIQDGKNGLLFKTGDPKDLFKKIKYLIENPSDIKRMSNEIRQVKTIEESAIEMEAIYNNLITKRG